MTNCWDSVKDIQGLCGGLAKMKLEVLHPTQNPLGVIQYFAPLSISKVPSGYLKKVLKNHTAHACEGEKLGITCPQKTSISILSAFYGRKVPDENFCPTLTGKTSENATCVSITARQVRSNFSESKGPGNFAFKRKPI